jgi:hypothetical protein
LFPRFKIRTRGAGRVELTQHCSDLDHSFLNV